MANRIAFPLFFAATLGLSYCLALAHEPQSAWLWCTILRAC
jgi:hypothetical protein